MTVHEEVIQKDFTTFAKAVSQHKGVEKETKFLEVDEYKNVIAGSKNKMNVQSYAVIYLIAVTGMRFSECLELTWDSVDYDNKVLIVDTTRPILILQVQKQKAVSERYHLMTQLLNY